MKIFKRFVSLLTAACLSATVFLSGCGTENNASSAADTTAAQTTIAETTVPETAPPSDRHEPLMWKVTGKNGGKMYLFGTIHIGDERSEQVMKSISSKVDECDSLAVECDTVSYQNDYSAIMKSVYGMMYLDGTDIQDHVDAELYEKSVKYLTERNSYNQMYDKYHPSFWLQLLQQTAVAESPLDSEYAMDTLLINHANETNRKILEVESVDEQYELLDSFSDELYSLLINEFLESESEYTNGLTEMYDTWLVGDEEKLYSLLEEDEAADEELTDEQIKLLEDYSDKMYTNRNNGMAEKAQGYLESGQTVFFAVGTAHMLGDTGLVKQLTDKGYTVEKITV